MLLHAVALATCHTSQCPRWHAVDKASLLHNRAVARCYCMRLFHNLENGTVATLACPRQGQPRSQHSCGMRLLVATWYMSQCPRWLALGKARCGMLLHAVASQPGTRHGAYAGLLQARPAFSTAQLRHAATFATWHMSWCPCWVA